LATFHGLPGFFDQDGIEAVAKSIKEDFEV
jgi:hypothetical protein